MTADGMHIWIIRLLPQLLKYILAKLAAKGKLKVQGFHFGICLSLCF